MNISYLYVLILLIVVDIHVTSGKTLLLHHNFKFSSPKHIAPSTASPASSALLSIQPPAVWTNLEGASPPPRKSLLVNTFTNETSMMHLGLAKTVGDIHLSTSYPLITLWYKATRLGKTDQRLIFKGNEAVPELEVGFLCDSTTIVINGVHQNCKYRLKIHLCADNDQYKCDASGVTSIAFNGIKPVAGQWVFLAVAWTSSGAHVFHRPQSAFNFTFADRTENAGSVYRENPTGGQLVIGNTNAVSGIYEGFYGYIDDVRFYSLETDEVVSIVPMIDSIFYDFEGAETPNPTPQPTPTPGLGTTTPPPPASSTAITTVASASTTLSAPKCTGAECIISLILFDTNTNELLLTLDPKVPENAYPIDASANVSVKAITGDNVVKVVFNLFVDQSDHVHTRAETERPFTLYSDGTDNGMTSSFAWKFDFNRMYTVTAAAYASTASGVPLVDFMTVRLRFLASSSSSSSAIAGLTTTISSAPVSTSASGFESTILNPTSIESGVAMGSLIFGVSAMFFVLLTLGLVVFCVLKSRRRRGRRAVRTDASGHSGAGTRKASPVASKRASRSLSRPASRTASSTGLRRGGAMYAPKRFGSISPRNQPTTTTTLAPTALFMRGLPSPNQYDVVGNFAYNNRTAGNYEAMDAPIGGGAPTYDRVEQLQTTLAANSYDVVHTAAVQYDQVQSPMQ